MTLTPIQAALIENARQSGQPLDPFDFDDAAVAVRGEQLVESGLSGSVALVQARAELAASRWPSRNSGEPQSAAERLSMPQPTLEAAMNDPRLYAEFIAPFAVEIVEANDPDEDSRHAPQTDIPDGKET